TLASGLPGICTLGGQAGLTRWFTENRSLLGTLGTVLGTALTALVDTGGVEAAAHGVITHTGQILHPATTDQDHTVLLKVVTFTADIGGDLVAVGQPHAADLAQR